MSRHDFTNQFTSGDSLVAADRTSTTNGSSLDCQDCGPEITCIVSSAAGSGTSPTLDFKLQTSPDDSTWTDLSGATMTQITDAAAAFEVKTFFTRNNRYVRVVATIGGTSPSFDCQASLHCRKVSY